MVIQNRQNSFQPDMSEQSPIGLTGSRYIKYLPDIYAGDEFTERFLSIFESVNRPIENTLDSLPFYFDSATSPESFLPWLANWVGLSLADGLPTERRRSLIRNAVKLFAIRGTKIGLIQLLEIYTGLEITIDERMPSFVLGPDSLLGTNTMLGMGMAYSFVVKVHTSGGGSPNVNQIDKIIEAEKPVNTNHVIEILE